MFSKTVVFAVAIIAFSCCLMEDSQALPSHIDTASATDATQICVTNCAQCKKMYGKYFQGRMCADSCVQSGGNPIPDCEDRDSIAPFIIASE